MNEYLTELLASIQRLTRAVAAETGYYCAYQENIHPAGVSVEVWIQTGEAPYTFTSFKGRNETIKQVRDDLAAWLAEHRSEVAA